MRRSTPTTSGPKPAARYGHSVTLIPAKRNIIVLGGTDGKQVENVQSPDPEFPPHKTTKSLHPMTVHVLDIDSAPLHRYTAVTRPLQWP